MAELDDFPLVTGVGHHGVAGLTLYRRGRHWTFDNGRSPVIAIISRNGLVLAEKVGNLKRGQYVNVFRPCRIHRDIH